MAGLRQLFPIVFATAACSGDPTADPAVTPVARVQALPDMGTVGGTSFSYDAHAAFSGTSVSYTVTFAPDANGLSANGSVIAGTPASPGKTMPKGAVGNTVDCCPKRTCANLFSTSENGKKGSQRRPRLRVSRCETFQSS